MAPDAIERLAAQLDRGSIVVSSTNGKTTTAGMIAGILAAAGRRPVHNRAGSNMHWGVATALLEQSGDEGLFELDEAWLPRVAPQLRPRLLVLGNLFRDQLDRYGELERLADEWAELVASPGGNLRVRPERRRSPDRGPRPGPGAAAPARRHLLRDRGHEPGAARAPARPRRQALPPLRRPLLLRAGLRRPPRATTPAPTATPTGRRRTSPPPRSSCTGSRARRVRIDDPRGRAGARAPPPRPLQRLQRARGGHRGAAVRRAPGPGPRGARVDARGLRARRDHRGLRQAGLDPADQEPGRRQRGASDPHPRVERRRRSTSGSRSTTGSRTAATSPGSGTPTSSCSPTGVRRVDLRRDPGARDGPAPQVRGLARRRRSR